jgi:hypothetical protein
MQSFTRQDVTQPDCLKGDQKLAGPAYWTELIYNGRHLNYAVRYSDRSPNFCAELGFVPRVDIRDNEYFIGYAWRPEKRRLQSFGPSIFGLMNWNYAGKMQDWFADAKFDATFTGHTLVEVRRVESYELFQNIDFRKHRTEFSLSTGALKWLSFSADYWAGTNENFFPGSGATPFLANAGNDSFGFTLRPSPRLRFDQTYIYSRLSTRAGSTPAPFAVGPSIFNNHILRSKLNYQFNRELSVRAIVDYNSVLPNRQLVALDPAKRLTADLLLTYLLNPGTAFYVGYTDRYENLSLDPGAPPLIPPTLSRTGSPSTSTGRQFFFKLSYLFRF